MRAVNAERMREICKEYTKRTRISAAELSTRIGYTNLLFNAIRREKISEKYVEPIMTAFAFAGIDASPAFIQPTAEKAPEAPEKPQDEQKEKSRPDDQDLRKELQRLRDDVADLGVLLNAIRDERARDSEKLLQAISRLTDKQLTQKQLGEEIVSGILLASGQMNIDEPARSAYATIRKGLKKDIYMAIKGDLK